MIRKIKKRINICNSAELSFKRNRKMAVMFNTAKMHGDLLKQEFLDKAKQAQKTHNENKFFWMKEL